MDLEDKLDLSEVGEYYRKTGTSRGTEVRSSNQSF